jgi:gluconate 2-dehydrogenase gamma chain
MTTISRRAALRILGAAPAAAALVWTPLEAEQAHEHAAQARAKAPAARFKPKFFTAHEYATVGVLVDLIIPRDERSGSATDAGVPEFMDFMMLDQPQRKVAMRGGLALIDRLATERTGKRFLDSTDAQRRALLDEIAYTRADGPRSTTASAEPGAARSAAALAERDPARTTPPPERETSPRAATSADAGRSQAIAFFNSFRDLTASGFWSSKMGVKDLQYQGNVFVDEWTGCPAPALAKLGVSYD